jgi:hypothetical protein
MKQMLCFAQMAPCITSYRHAPSMNTRISIDTLYLFAVLRSASLFVGRLALISDEIPQSKRSRVNMSQDEPLAQRQPQLEQHPHDQSPSCRVNVALFETSGTGKLIRELVSPFSHAPYKHRVLSTPTSPFLLQYCSLRQGIYMDSCLLWNAHTSQLLWQRDDGWASYGHFSFPPLNPLRPFSLVLTTTVHGIDSFSEIDLCTGEPAKPTMVASESDTECLSRDHRTPCHKLVWLPCGYAVTYVEPLIGRAGGAGGDQQAGFVIWR